MLRQIVIVITLGMLAGCTSVDRFGNTGYLHCSRVSEIESVEHCKATVEKIQPCGVLLKTDDGRSLSLAGPCGGEPEVIRFMRTLKAGHTYTFPKAFFEFQQQNKEPNRVAPTDPIGASRGSHTTGHAGPQPAVPVRCGPEARSEE